MKKILLSLLVSLFLCGCGGNSGVYDNSDEYSENKPIIKIEQTKEESQLIDYTEIEFISPDPWEGRLIDEFTNIDINEEYDYYIDERLPEDLRNVIISKRAHELVEFTEEYQEAANQLVQAFQSDYNLEEDIEFSRKILPEHFEKKEQKERVSKEEAIEDIDFLFDYLKYYYAGYGYFGGDEVFIPLKQSIITQINNKDDPIYVPNLISSILVKTLYPIIIDCHFSIGNVGFYKFHCYNKFLANEDMTFIKEDNKYITKIDDITYELLTVNGNPAEGRLYPSIDKDGYFCWILGLTSIEEKTVNVPIELKEFENENILTRDVKLKPVEIYSPEQEMSYSIDKINDIPLRTTNEMTFKNFDSDETLSMMEDAKKLRDEPFFIIDVRGNHGGHSIFPMSWIEAYADLDAHLPSRNVRFYRRTETMRAMGILDEQESLLDWAIRPYAPVEKLNNDNLLVS